MASSLSAQNPIEKGEEGGLKVLRNEGQNGSCYKSFSPEEQSLLYPETPVSFNRNKCTTLVRKNSIEVDERNNSLNGHCQTHCDGEAVQGVSEIHSKLMESYNNISADSHDSLSPWMSTSGQSTDAQEGSDDVFSVKKDCSQNSTSLYNRLNANSNEVLHPEEPNVSRQGTTSDYSSLSSCSSLRKSDLLNGNLIDFHSSDMLNHCVTDNNIEDQRSIESSATLLHRENSDLTVGSQHQPTTPTGSCLKAGNKPTSGVHVQFDTTLIKAKDSLILNESIVVENGKVNAQNNTDGTKYCSKLQSDSCESTPFSSLKKHRKKRSRQPSGSSTASIGSCSTNTSESRTTEFERRAPDGGWGWVVVFASFMVHCIADGVTMSFGVLYVEFLDYFQESKSLTSWVGSLFMAIPLLAGPLASLLTDRYGCRTVTIWGSIIACIGFFISAFANSILVLFLTVGIITGIGLAVCYVAAIVIVAFYFEKYRSLATGIAVAGSGIGTFVFAPVIQHLLDYFGWRGCLIILAGIFLNMAVCGALMRDLEWTKRRPDNRPSSTNTSSASRQCSVTQSSDTIGTRICTTENALPSLDELKRLVQSGEIASILSVDENKSNVIRSESLVLLPTYLNNSVFPKDFLPYLSSKANAYEIVSQIYPHLLSRSLSETLSQSDLLCKDIAKEAKSKCLQVQISLQNEDDLHGAYLSNLEPEEELNETSSLIEIQIDKEQTSNSPWAKLDIDEAKILSPKRNAKSTNRQMVPRRISSSCIGGTTNPALPVAPLRDMKVSRQSMTFRGAMLNIHRYRLRASSCPNIFRNSIITIAETENQNAWSYLDDFGAMLKSCVDLNYCLDASYLIFALSNFILYVFYDTVYMYLTDYAIGIGISPDTGANLISAIGILNCVGMVLMGYIGDKTWGSPMLIYNFSMVACGLSVIAMPFVTNFWCLAATSAIFGLFISANYALTAVILVDLISLEAFSKSYGLLLLIQGIANLIGPPLVGLMADATGDYVLPFVISGIFIVICGLMLSLIPLLQRCKERYSLESTPTSSPRQSPKRLSPQKSLPESNYPVDV